MITAIGLYIAVMINGEQQEAVVQVYDTVAECLVAEQQYTKDIVVESGCFTGVFKETSTFKKN